MPQTMQNRLQQYVRELAALYGSHLKQVILYGSYARGDYKADSDVDIMILLDIADMEAKAYFDRLIDITYDYNITYRKTDERERSEHSSGPDKLARNRKVPSAVRSIYASHSMEYDLDIKPIVKSEEHFQR